MMLRTQLYSIYALVRRIFWMLAGGRREKAFGYTLQLHPRTEFPAHRHLMLPRDAVRKAIVRYGDFVQLHAICSFLEQRQRVPVVVEVGAHHGAYASLLGRIVRRKHGRVLAIEPDRGSFEILTSNIIRNGLTKTVVCLNTAVMPKAGRYSVKRHGSETYLADQAVPGDNIIDTQPLRTILDEMDITHIDVLLIDVEGAELPVLESIDWKRVTIDRVFCEMHPYRWNDFGYEAQRMTNFLKEHRLRCMDMYMQEQKEFRTLDYVGPTILFPADDKVIGRIQKKVPRPSKRAGHRQPRRKK